MSIGIGLSLNNSAATISGLLRRGGVFARTPKIPAAARNPPALYRSAAVWSLWGEATLALYFWVCVAAAGPLRSLVVPAFSLPVRPGV